MRRLRLLLWAAAMTATMLLATSSPAMAEDFEVVDEIDGVPVVLEFEVECVEDDDDFDGLFGEDSFDGFDNDSDGFTDEDDVECEVLLEDVEVA